MDINKISFNAIDFETSTGKRDSACAVAIVTVKNAEIVDTWSTLIKPPNNYYSQANIDIHKITPNDTINVKPFFKVYNNIKDIINGKPLVAHNESFDRSVLYACMDNARIDRSDIHLSPKWYCTNKKYKELGHKVTKLNVLCEEYDIELDHHNHLSDAIACAKLFIKYLKQY